MNRRRLMVGGGASAVALTMAGVATRRAVDAQEATPTPAPGTETPATTETETSHYDEFVAALATALGSGDATTVDGSIRTALKQMVDDEFAAGNISANEATARKEQIATTESPLGGFGFGGRGGRHDGPGAKGGPNDGRANDGSADPGTTDPATEATPSTL